MLCPELSSQHSINSQDASIGSAQRQKKKAFLLSLFQGGLWAKATHGIHSLPYEYSIFGLGAQHPARKVLLLAMILDA